MSVTPIGPAEPGGEAPADAAADGDAGDVDAPGVLQATLTTARPAINTSPRSRVARFLDSIMRGFLLSGRNVDNVVCGL